MRIDVKKFLFVGLNKDRSLFFEKAQKAGIIHFIDINPSASKEVSPEVHDISAAIKILRGLPTTEQEETDEYALADGLASKILQLKHKLDKLAEEQKILNLEITRVEAYGDFSLDDIAYIEKDGQRKIQFFCAKSGFADEANLPENLIYIASEHGLDYFIAINKEPVQYEKMSELQIDRPLGVLQKRLKEVKHETHETERLLKGYAKYNRFLHHALIHKLNVYHLHTAQSYSQMVLDNDLFAIEGWVPQNQLQDLNTLAKEMQVYMEEVAIEPTDRIPTYLENKGIHRVGEDLVHIYDTPSHTDKDPSIWILFFFAFFFAMIIGDAGYGLVFLGIALWIRYKYKIMPAVGRRVWILLLVLCLACITWGSLTTSFFGISIGMESPLRKFSLITWLVEKKAEYHLSHHDEVYKEWVKKIPQLKDAKNGHEFILKGVIEKDGHPVYAVYNQFSDQIMMEIALLIGVVHIISSFARYLDRNLVGIGWIAFIVGCYLYFPFYLNATSIIHYVLGADKVQAGKDGLYLIIGGVTLAVILGIVKHKLLGVLEIMTVIQIFADAMSYLRLYALGLAGAMVTSIINEFAGALPFVLGAVLFLVGHLTNMALGIMGGIIHGLRLNFLEWYHYSFEGGGKVFNPLRLLKVE
jgi:V/A-type H+-transporting ATPase subunit I